jgi:hypothetical protein
VRAFSIPRFVSIVLSSYFLLHISKSTKINVLNQLKSSSLTPLNTPFTFSANAEKDL